MPRAALIEAGGAMVIKDLLTPEWFQALRSEALSRRASAKEQRKEAADPGGWRAGNPDRFLASAEAGPVLDEVYSDEGLIAQLAALSGARLQPTGTRGSYSYYDRPGHYLGLHRDIKTCDVTLITCLDQQHGDRRSGALRLYPKAIRKPLDCVHRNDAHRDVEMTAGQSVMLLGGCIPHEVLPASPGYRRVIGVLCFEMQIAPTHHEDNRQLYHKS